MDVIGWLLDGDPAIAWQVRRDLADAPPDVVAATRKRVAHEGLGAKILANQGAEGVWHRTDKPDWMPTLYTLLLLRATGVDRSEHVVESAIARLEAGFLWDEEFRDRPNKTFFDGEVEPCINGGVLALGAYFGRPADALAIRLVGDRLADGGWNCDAPPSSKSSFHSTICVLEGLLEYERAAGESLAIAGAKRAGENYLLERALYRRRSTGESAHPDFLRFAFPPRYRYDVLRSLDYFRAAGHAPGEQFRAAIEIVARARQPDGRWLLDACYDEALSFAFDEPVGEPSRWNTLRALRVLRWYGSPTTRR